MGKIYFDYAATTPMDPLIKKAMAPYFCEKFGNPGSLHSFGQEALAAVDESREKIAKTIGADFREIIFTSSATEANNLTLRGVVRQFKILNLKFKITPRIIVSSIEHESILETCKDLRKDGIEIIYLPVNKQGIVDLKKLKESLNERTILVSIMYANNEIGTIQPIAEISKLISEFRMQNLECRINSKFLIHNSELATALPLLHTDAVQAFQFLNCDVNDLGIDLMTLSAHKIYGPKGIGLLYHKLQTTDYKLRPIITGGGQEFGFRSGTENVPAIVGFAKAIELAEKNREKEFKRITELSAYFWKEIKKIYPVAQINADDKQINADNIGENQRSHLRKSASLPNILNIYFPNQNAQDLLMKLDLNGIAVSSGSACSARTTKISHVLKAISLPENKIKNSLRFSFGKFTNKKEINGTIKIIKKILN